MPIDTPTADLVRQLSRVGLRPDARLTEQIIGRGAEARAELLKLATHIDALHAEDLPVALGPLHALRLLGELPDPEMIPSLLNVLPIPVGDEEDVPARLYAGEVLQMIARVGEPAVELLWAIADEAEVGEARLVAAIHALPYVATFVPETRDAIIAEARRRLDEERSVEMTTGAAVVLAELGDSSSYQKIMAAYRGGKIDQSKAPAAAARQFLLGGGRQDLTCVRHPLWERYDQHGPSFQTEE